MLIKYTPSNINGYTCIDIRCICALATEIFGKIPVASTRTHDCGEEKQLSSGWTLIGSELSSPNLNSSVRAKDRSRFVIST